MSRRSGASSTMSSRSARMSTFLRRVQLHPEIGPVFTSIKKLNPVKLVQELDLYGLNTEGTANELAERLLRFELRKTQPSFDVPWDRDVDERGESPPATTKALNMEESVEKMHAPGTSTEEGRGGQGVMTRRKTREAAEKAKELDKEEPGGKKDAKRVRITAQEKLNTAEEKLKAARKKTATAQKEATTAGTNATKETGTRTVGTAVERSPGVTLVTSSTRTPIPEWVEQGGLTPASGGIPTQLTNWGNMWTPEALVSALAQLAVDPRIAGLLRAQTMPPNVPAYHNFWQQPPASATAQPTQVIEEPLINELGEEEDEESVQTDSVEEEESVKEGEETEDEQRQYRLSLLSKIDTTPLRELSELAKSGARKALRAEFDDDRASNRAKSRHDEASRPRDAQSPSINGFLEDIGDVRTSTRNHGPRGNVRGNRERSPTTRPKARTPRPLESSDTESSDEDTIYHGPIAVDKIKPKNNSTRSTQKKASSGNQQSLRKDLKGWDLKFSGEGKDALSAEDFIKRLDDFRTTTEWRKEEILTALPYIFTKTAATWYRNRGGNSISWKRFVREFRRRFIGDHDDDELLDELMARTQGKEEKMETYLDNFRQIVSLFREPPSLKRQLVIVYRNLQSSYRNYIDNHEITCYEDLEELGRRHERIKDINQRWAPPPARDKARIASAAYVAPLKVQKVAGLEECTGLEGANANEAN